MRNTLTLVLFTLILACLGCPPSGRRDAAAAHPSRLRVINGGTSPLWIFYQNGAGGGSMSAPHQLLLAGGGHYDYPIPDRGIAGTRFWAGYNCDSTGNNCQIGQSGGPASEGFSCPSYGCAPPIDSKFEGTFGCLSSVPVAQCQPNPSSPTHDPLPRTDGWDTSMVDGFTLPFTVRVIGSCPNGPDSNLVDCSTVPMSECPTAENLSTNGAFPTLGAEDMRLLNPQTGTTAGCYSDCARLTFSQWSGLTYTPASAQAQMYCCPTPPVTPNACRQGPVASTSYTELVHRTCNETYAYSYDDASGLFSCPAGVRYEVTFFGPR